MAETIHQTYRDLLQEVHTDNLRSFAGVPALRDPFGGALYLPASSQSSRSQSKIGSIFMGIVAGLGISALVFTTYSNRSAAVTPILPPIVATKTPAPETVLMQNEMDLMKKILVGLVASVQNLSTVERHEEKEIVTDLDEVFPYPVQVTSEKANLRVGPNRTEKSLGIVSKNTVLLATDGRDGWMKISTPKGEQAWISADVVREKEEQ